MRCYSKALCHQTDIIVGSIGMTGVLNAVFSIIRRKLYEELCTVIIVLRMQVTSLQDAPVQIQSSSSQAEVRTLTPWFDQLERVNIHAAVG